MPAFEPPHYPPAPTPASGARHKVVVVGAGLVGLTVALDLARRGQHVVVLDDDDTVSSGSRAICFAKRTIEIYDRMGIGAAIRARGTTWNTGRVYFGEREVYGFNLLAESGHRNPAFVNIQQYYVEHWLVEACLASGRVDLRWRHKAIRVENGLRGATIDVETPDGTYTLEALWLLACDGAHSVAREALGLPFLGKVFRDRFLIADVVMHADFPAERRFWFEPPFHKGGSVLLHRQADNVWRIDFQIGWDADPEAERDPARVEARVRAMLGPDIPFSLEWVSVYTFRCRRIEKFRHGHTIFLGDSAHQVSPFGARGGNGGVQDADNLGWKLDAVLRGAAPDSLLDSYDLERIPAAEENILNSTRSTDFLTPKNDAARAYRDAVLELAAQHEFARPLVNSGRLSRPAVLRGSPLSTPDETPWNEGAPLGAAAPDAPLGDGFLLDQAAGDGFTLLLFGTEAPAIDGVTQVAVPPGSVAAERFGAASGSAILLRPDQHVAARWRRVDPAAIARARDRALGRAA